MNDARLTICIPAYNEPAFLRDALLSVCSQGLRKTDYEVVVSDDASPLPLDAVVADFKDRLQIRYERSPHNLGHIANFARAASFARTPFLSLLSHDDIVAPGHFGSLLPILESATDIVFAAGVVVYCSYPGAPGSYVVGTSLRRHPEADFMNPYRWNPTEWQAAVLIGTPFSMVGSIFRTSAFLECDEWKKYPLWHDRVWCHEIGTRGGVITVPWFSGYFRVSPNQLSGRLSESHGDEFRKVSMLVWERSNAAGNSVRDFWYDYLCTASPQRRSHFIRLLRGALPPAEFLNLKKQCEQSLKTRITLGGRIGSLHLPWKIEAAIRQILGT
jgi:glycosyltransferase involved in cell wall biosynthesis